ncbi:MAG TPA: hypothetical protein VGF84_04315 [Micromonosporaceae bacterium]
MLLVTVVPQARPVVAAEPMPPRTGVGASIHAGTTARMITSLTVLVLLSLAFGIAGASGASQRASLVGSVRTGSGPLALDAQQLYRALSDADATAGEEFLYSSKQGPDPVDLAALRTRYLGDIGTASADLTAVSSSRTDSPALRALAAGIPIYSGLVETARANSRLGLPLGAAYLREASNQMRTVLLIAAKSLYDAEIGQLDTDRDNAGGFPWLALPLGVIVLIALVSVQRTMARRTRRVFNIGLVVATLATVVAFGWITVAWASDSIHLKHSASTGSDRVNVLANARIDLLRARADEELTLIARGNDPSFDHDYTVMMADAQRLLAQDPDRGIAADLTAWQREDQAMRKLNESGHYPDAVDDTIGSTATDAPALFATVDGALSAAIDSANAGFQKQSAAAANDLSGLWITVSVLTVITLLGLILGFQRRLAEYR